MSRSKNVLVCYNVGNSTQAGFDIAKEIRWLGKDRICQFHFKDNPHFLGAGSIHFGFGCGGDSSYRMVRLGEP
jgi:L-ribulose-5-phosphate 3-epimerase